MRTLEEPVRPAAPAVRSARLRGWLVTSSRSRELVLLGLGSFALAVLMSWPLALHPGHRIAQDLGDPVRTAWQIAWIGHALIHQPLHIWNSNAFWPYGNSLAFSDSLLGYAPFGLIGHGEVAALVRYNFLFLFAYALAFAGAYLLGRELGLRPLGAVVVGAAFAYAPFRSTMNGHLHVISSGGIPLSLALLLRGYKRESWRFVLAGWLVATWQLSLGFTLGLQLAYLLAVLAIVVAAIWWRRGRPAPPRPLVTATVAGVALFAVVGAYQSRPYLQVSHDFASAKRSIGQVRNYSASPRAFIAATPENRIWSGALASQRNSLRSPNESALFPGLSIVLLALAGVTSAVYAKRLRVGLAIGIFVCAVLSLGLGIFNGRLSYRLLYDYAPGWDGVRTPGRITTLTSLGLALLAGAGAQRVALWMRGRKLSPVLALALPVIVLVEGSWTLWKPHVPSAPRAQLGIAEPQLHLPMHPSDDRLYQFWSVDGFPEIYNGVSTFDIPRADKLRADMRLFPNRKTIDELRRIGIRSVVLHTDLAGVPLPPPLKVRPEPSNPRHAATKSVAGLGVTVKRYPRVVIYELGRRG